LSIRLATVLEADRIIVMDQSVSYLPICLWTVQVGRPESLWRPTWLNSSIGSSADEVIEAIPRE
jgi:hypothetical protein